MTFHVYQHWDPLRVCVVGRCYPPEFFSWIENSQIRNIFERIAIETEEDLQKIVKKKLQDFGVEIMRPEIAANAFDGRCRRKPPITPRDHMVMIGEHFYDNYSTNFSKLTYDNIKDPAWPDCSSWDDFNQLSQWIQEECKKVFNFGLVQEHFSEYDSILDTIRKKNTVYSGKLWVNGAMVARIGRDLFFGTDTFDQDIENTQSIIDAEFPFTRNHVINTGGHSDSTYCPVCPGLIISTHDVDCYQHTFPDWEVVYIENSNLIANKKFNALVARNKGKWWIPGFEDDSFLIHWVDTYFSNWVGNVIETVFDVNMLIIDPKNVIVFNEHEVLFDTFRRYNITAHVINFRHRYFWDGGIHCLTIDLHRQGTLQDFFPHRI